MITLLLYVALIGLICWAIVKFIPMPEPFPKIIIGVGALIAILLVLQAFGVHTGLSIPALKD
jgi:hypothetical protein